MQLGRVLVEEFEVCCACDVTFVLPDCYVGTKETGNGGQGNNPQARRANTPRACGGLLLGLVSNRAINLLGVLVTRGFG